MNAPSAKTFILAAKVAKERAALTDWMKKRFLPSEADLVAIEAHRKLWRAAEIER